MSKQNTTGRGGDASGRSGNTTGRGGNAQRGVTTQHASQWRQVARDSAAPSWGQAANGSAGSVPPLAPNGGTGLSNSRRGLVPLTLGQNAIESPSYNVQRQTPQGTSFAQVVGSSTNKKSTQGQNIPGPSSYNIEGLAAPQAHLTWPSLSTSILVRPKRGQDLSSLGSGQVPSTPEQNAIGRLQGQTSNISGNASSYNTQANPHSHGVINSVYKPNFLQPGQASVALISNSSIMPWGQTFQSAQHPFPLGSQKGHQPLPLQQYEQMMEQQIQPPSPPSPRGTMSLQTQPQLHQVQPIVSVNQSARFIRIQRRRLLQPYPSQMPPTTQDLEDGYNRMVMRLSDTLLGMHRSTVDQYVTSSPFYYDAIVPQRDLSATQLGYESYSPMQVNLYPVKINSQQIWRYQVEWVPPMISIKGTVRTWKMQLWKQACQQAEAQWTPHVKSVLAPLNNFGLGAWNLGPLLYRAEEIPDTILRNRNLNPLKWTCVHQSRQNLWDTTLRHISMEVVGKNKSHIGRAVPLPTDMMELITIGGDHTKWNQLREALGAIFSIYPHFVREWVEDMGLNRMFFPTQYLPGPRDPPPTPMIKETVFYPSVNNPNDMFVTRRGLRIVPRLYPGGIFINVWTCLAPFYVGGLFVDYAIDVVLKEKSNRSYTGGKLSPMEMKWISDALTPIRVKTKLTQRIQEYLNPETYPTRYYRIWGFSKVSCETLKVPIYARDPTTNLVTKTVLRWMNFLQYCKQLYTDAFKQWPELNFNLVDQRLKDLPAVKVRKDLDFYFPPWALEIREFDRHSFKLGGVMAHTARRMRKDLYRFKGADEYFQYNNIWLKEWLEKDIHLPVFNMNVTPVPYRVPGCVLPKPTDLMMLDFGTNELIKPKIGIDRWECPQRGRLIKYADFDDYMILYFDETDLSQIENWLSLLLVRNNIKPDKLTVLHRTTPHIRCCGKLDSAQRFVDEFNIALAKFNQLTQKTYPDLVLLFMPLWDGRHGVYDAFKYQCDIAFGIKSQVVLLGFKWEDPARPTFQECIFHILLKFNRKMGGTNILLKSPYINEENMPGTMIFGSDVTHTAQGVEHSIASVVATTDMPPRTYAARVRIQHANQEMIQELQTMVKELVQTFNRNNPGVVLERVFFFRDGVAEEMWSELMEKEIPAIFNGLRAGGSPYAKLVFMLTIKRHHTRFRDYKNAGDISSGVVVNELPLYPLQTSFFLCSHRHPSFLNRKEIRMGTKRATLYHLLIDQLGLPLPHLQTMIYHLCFLYDRSCHTPSIVPASHYAHLACSRGRSHYLQLRRVQPGIHALFPDSQPWAVPYAIQTITCLDAHDKLKDTMYYI